MQVGTGGAATHPHPGNQLARPHPLAWLELEPGTAIHPIGTAAQQMAINVLIGARLDDQPHPTAPVIDHLFDGPAPPIADGRTKGSRNIQAVVGLEGPPGASATSEGAGVTRKDSHRENP